MEYIGLASGILTFIDVAAQIVRGTYEIHKSVSGAVRDNIHIAAVAADLEKAALGLQAIPDAQNDPELITVAKACQTLSRELAKELDGLQKKHGGVWQSFAKACAVLRKQRSIEGMENLIDRYRQQVQFRLMCLLIGAQSPMKQQMQTIYQSGVDISNVNARRMDNLERKLSATLQQESDKLAVKIANSTENFQHVASTARDEAAKQHEQMDELCSQFGELSQLVRAQASAQRDEMSESLGELLRQLQDLASLIESIPRENRVLRRLDFGSIRHRESNIESPISDTYEWIVHALGHRPASPRSLEPVALRMLTDEQLCRENASTKLEEFLTISGQTLFIYGKAGCGKSTLMKFLAHHDRVREELNNWAGSHPLIVVSMFFWRSSEDQLQQSLQGFYRTILFHTLRQCPELISRVFPGNEGAGIPDAAEFQIKELEDGFNRLTHVTATSGHRFCYFIDGLDEYDGQSVQQKRLAEMLARWGRFDTVKIVCSARPDTIFLRVFKDAGNVIDFGPLNRSDIAEFASARFASELSHHDYTSGRKHCAQLVGAIVDKAEGVFLWAAFAVGSLINGVIEGDDDKESLNQRLKEFSKASNPSIMFQKMLDRVDSTPHVRKRSNMLLYLAAHNTRKWPINGLLCSWLEDLGWLQGLGHSEFPFNQTLEPYSFPTLDNKLTKCRKLLHLLTQGLLELQDTTGLPTSHSDTSPTDLYLRYRVGFPHRSVGDFLREEWYFNAKLFASPGEELQAYCRLYIAEVQFLPTLLSASGDYLDNVRNLFEFTFIWLSARASEGCPMPFRFLRQLELIVSDPLPGQATDSSLLYDATSPTSRRTAALFPDRTWLTQSTRWKHCFLGILQIGPRISRRWHTKDGSDCSFLHWAAYWGLGHYVRLRLETEVSLPDVDGTTIPDILISASVGTDIGLVHYLFSKGYRPDDIRWYGTQGGWAQTTVWLIVLRDFVNNARSYFWKLRNNAVWPPHVSHEWLRRFAEVLEAHLRAGADHGVYFMVSTGPASSEDTSAVLPSLSTQTRVVHLCQILQAIKPPNLASLESLLTPNDGRPLSTSNETTASDQYAADGLAPLGMTAQDIVNLDWEVLGVADSNNEILSGIIYVRVF